MVKRRGFSIIEIMASVLILGMIASITGYSLVRTGRAEELNTATRVVVADLRSLQSRALTVQNIKSCTNGSGIRITCEASTTGCVSACTLQPPAGMGARFTVGAGSYDFFAEVGSTSTNWVWNAGDQFFTRTLSKSGAPNVTISAIDRGSPSSVAFERQNGAPVFNACRISQGCITTPSIAITLRHAVSLVTKTIVVNASGRISIQ